MARKILYAFNLKQIKKFDTNLKLIPIETLRPIVWNHIANKKIETNCWNDINFLKPIVAKKNILLMPLVKE